MNLPTGGDLIVPTGKFQRTIAFLFKSQIFKAMKLTIVFLTAFLLQANAKTVAQNVTLNVKNATLEKVFREIEHQTGFGFLFTGKMLRDASRVTIDVTNEPISKVLEYALRQQPLEYTIDNNTIVISRKEKSAVLPIDNSAIDGFVQIAIHGIITDENGNPLEGVSVIEKGTTNGTSTDSHGAYTLEVKNNNSVLIFSIVGYFSQNISVRGRIQINISLKPDLKIQDEVVVIPYGTTTKRMNTGSIAKIKGEDIRKQPVENPMLALGGRLPGLQISQTSGVSGAPVSVMIRGINSLGGGSVPLYIIDGVPFANALGNVTFSSGLSAQGLGGLTSASTYTSPFVNLNPSDIESIEVLKDADATSIYGSKGANGVILITTRKAKAGKTKVDASFYSGGGRPTRLPQMMNTQQYVMMRNEAFRNNNIIPTTTNATDLTVWDTTRYNDWTKLLLGNTAHNADAQIRLSGGGAQTQFSLTTGYHRETPIFYGDMHDDRVNVHANLIHHSNDNKFSIALNTTYSNDNNNSNTTNLGQLLTTIPNSPYPLDASGNLVWQDKGINFSNPLAYIKKPYSGITENSISSINLAYHFSKSFQLKVDGGMNVLRIDQNTQNPISSQSPYGTSLISSASFYNMVQKNWIVEPQAEYTKQFGKSRINILVGTSFQQQLSEGNTINASGYTNDQLLGTPGPAATKTVSSAYAKYRYNAVFGRITYDWDGKYLANISGRRDGSSKFGPSNQFGNFGAVGAGWIFTEEKFIKKFSFLDYGKLRGSMGVTGNDQIGDYQYIARWSTTNAAVPYQGITGLYPANLENPNFGWERNRKWEAGMELSFLKSRIFFSADFYLNKTDNQLIGYSLPSQTGFQSVTANRNAIVENRGWEFMINTVNYKSKDFTWRSDFNITIPTSKLLAYPDLASSSYATVLIIGQPTTIRKYIPYLGVDPLTGVYQLSGLNPSTDRTSVKNPVQKFYGGLQNTLTYKRFSLDFFLHFVKQTGLTSILFQAPGTRANQPVYVLNRWQKSGDITNVQEFSTTGAANTQYSYYANYSDARVADASFIRLKNVSISYEFDRKLIKKFKADQLRIYLQGQNLWTITKYKIGDPETLSFSDSPIRMFTAGIQVVF